MKQIINEIYEENPGYDYSDVYDTSEKLAGISDIMNDGVDALVEASTGNVIGYIKIYYVDGVMSALNRDHAETRLMEDSETRSTYIKSLLKHIYENHPAEWGEVLEEI